MKRWVFALTLVSATLVYAQNGQGQNGQGDNNDQDIPRDASGGTLQRGVSQDHLPHGAGGGAGTNNMTYHNGRVLPASKIYQIWWGNQSAFPSDAFQGMTDFANGLNGSTFLSSTDIFTQYMLGAGNASTAFVTNYTDSSTPPRHSPSTNSIINEACRQINSHGLTADTNALYVVYTSNFPGNVNYCAWHSWGSCNGTQIQVAYMPNVNGIAGCDPGNQYSCNSYSQGTRALANVVSHEFSEAITDPDGGGWYDQGGAEIGDKCAWQFSSCVQLGSTKWQLQTEWSNAVSGCVQK
jgi:hypothetical protein